jgi:hypothetical protein
MRKQKTTEQAPIQPAQPAQTYPTEVMAVSSGKLFNYDPNTQSYSYHNRDEVCRTDGTTVKEETITYSLEAVKSFLAEQTMVDTSQLPKVDYAKAYEEILIKYKELLNNLNRKQSDYNIAYKRTRNQNKFGIPTYASVVLEERQREGLALLNYLLSTLK